MQRHIRHVCWAEFVADKCVKFRDPRLNRSQETQPKAVGHLPNFDNCRSEVAGDVTSGVALDYVGMDVQVKFGDFRLSSGRIIQLFG